MRITLVRHAEVIEEYRGKYNGHIDIPLSLKGKNDAIKLAKKLQDEVFDKIYCSDLLRARETLEAFEYKSQPVFTNRLREKSWGIHEGKSFDEIQAQGIEYRDFEQWISSLGGEDINRYQERVKNYFNETIFKQKAGNMLIITHAGVINSLIGLIKGVSIEKAFATTLPYASYIILDTKSMKFLEL